MQLIPLRSTTFPAPHLRRISPRIAGGLGRYPVGNVFPMYVPGHQSPYHWVPSPYPPWELRLAETLQEKARKLQERRRQWAQEWSQKVHQWPRHLRQNPFLPDPQNPGIYAPNVVIWP